LFAGHGATLVIERSKLRAWYARRQGLDGSLQGETAAKVLERAGWARSVGGVSPYLTLFSRAGITREQADADAAKLKIYELPSARGCTYVLPASDFALGLASGQGFDSDMKAAVKLGVTEKEIAKLCDAVVAALEKGPLSPDELREATGKATRNLGEEGKKKGVTTTLPLALGELQASGDIRRVSTNGRFDQQRYQYALWRPNPLRGFKLSPEEVQTELARRYFAWIGPASLTGFQTFSGLGVKAAKAALDRLKLEPIEIAPGDQRFFLSGDREKFGVFQASKEPSYSLLGSIDSLLLLGNLKDLLDPVDQRRKVEGASKEIGALADLPSHAIVDRGRVIGLWEYDPTTESIAWMSFVKKDKALGEAVTRTENFVRAQLGDARSFSLDSPKSRLPRIQALRKAGASA
jgi:Winged helix DNA-binding domain